MPTQTINRPSITDQDLLSWKRDLPKSRVRMPSTPRNLAKYAFWKIWGPIHPHIRDILIELRITSHDYRQRYLIGRLAPGVSVKDLASFLVGKGFGNHFVAWIDRGEVLGLRKLDGFSHQYHIRVFEDGEVRGHYEYTPEYSPWMHYKESCFEDRRADFLEVLGDKIVPISYNQPS